MSVLLNGRFLVQPFSGVQRFATEIATAMLRRGDADALLAPPGQRARLAADVDGLVRVVGTRSGHVWEQLDLPRRSRPDVLVNLGNTAPLVAGSRQLVVVHDCGWASTPDAYSRSFRLSYRAVQTALVRLGARIVTVSQFSQGEIRRHLGASPDRVAIIVEGADHMERIVADPSVLAAHDLAPRRYVLAVGNLARHKNLGALRLLAERLAARGLVLAVAGAARSGAFRAGAADAVGPAARLLGRVTDECLRALYENAAAFVFPSRYEGFGLPAVEALASRCPVVASDIPALREICGDAALYADPGSPELISDAVLRLVDDQALAGQLAERSRPLLAAYRWDRAAAALGALARELEAGGDARSRADTAADRRAVIA